MARFNANTADNYGGNGGGNFFSLKNDRDTARVRFMYNGVDDIEGYAVHEIKDSEGRKKYVNCLREYGEPISNCPFCKKGMFQLARVYIPLYDVDTKTVKVWERSKKFISKIVSLMGRYPNFVSHTFDIERNGAKGDMKTTYEIYEVGSDDTRLEDLPELPKVLGTFVLDKSYDEMETYIKTGSFEPSGVVRRSSYSADDDLPFDTEDYSDNRRSRDDSYREENRRYREENTRRRTPENSRRGSDNF